MKGVLFDLDGVIADTAVYHFKAWRELIQKYYQVMIPQEVEEKTKGVTREDSLRVILNHLSIKVDDNTFKKLAYEKNELYVEALSSLSKESILPGIEDFITELKNNDVKIALASASKNGPIILEKLGLLQEFDAIVDPSTIIAGKPAPDIFLAAAEALNLQPHDCVGIEDAVAGVNAINEAGAMSVACGGDELSHAFVRYPSTAELNYQDINEIWKTQFSKGV